MEIKTKTKCVCMLESGLKMLRCVDGGWIGRVVRVLR